MKPRPAPAKTYSREALIERFGRPREKTVVFTNGVFDILHRGHAAYLAEARALGDVLVVGVNSDKSARGLGKGPDRPIHGQNDRALLLAALEVVDAVCLFDEPTPRELIAALSPDVLVKGGDYAIDAVVGRSEVESAGGRVVLIPFVDGYSTTSIVQRIKGNE